MTGRYALGFTTDDMAAICTAVRCLPPGQREDAVVVAEPGEPPVVLVGDELDAWLSENDLRRVRKDLARLGRLGVLAGHQPVVFVGDEVRVTTVELPDEETLDLEVRAGPIALMLSNFST